MIVSVFSDLGATHVYELVSAKNIPSRRMVGSCGLRHEPDLVCGIAIPNDGALFTPWLIPSQRLRQVDSGKCRALFRSGGDLAHPTG
jgi:hypothetical protein